jgi:hypothetical protein
MKHRCLLNCLLFVTLINGPAVAAGEIEMLPSKRLIEPFTANATEHRMSLAKVLDENRYIGSFGGLIPLVGLQYGEAAAQFSIAGTFYTHLSCADHQFIVTNGDYFVDALLDVRVIPSLAIRTGIGHTSQHLMDDAIEVLDLGHSINYVRDYIQVIAVHNNAAIGGFLYAGLYYNTTFIIDNHLDGTMIYELGGEAVNAPIAPTIRIYCAADIKLRGESHFGTSQNYQVGLKFAPETGGRTVRLAINYQTGLEERGQFYTRHISQTVLGFYLDL